MIWLKRLLLAALLLLVLLIIAAGVFIATVNPNDYKQQIAALVQEKTGRLVSFNGPIRLSVFPWLGVRLESVAVGNAPGFMPENMLQAKVVEAKAAFWPLLQGRFEIGKLVLDGAQIHLARNRAGVTNWADLRAASPEKTTAAESSAAPAVGNAGLMLSIGGVEIHHALLDWQDAVTGVSLQISDLNAQMGAFASSMATPVSMQANYLFSAEKIGELRGSLSASADISLPSLSAIRADQVVLTAALKTVGGAYPAAYPRTVTVQWQSPTVTVDLAKTLARVPQFSVDASMTRGFGLTRVSSEMSGDVQANWGAGRYDSQALQLTGAIQGIATHTGEVKFNARGGLAVDLPAGTARLRDWQVHSDPVTVSTSLEVAGLGQALKVTGPLTVASFNPRDLAAAWKYRVPPMASERALTECALTGQIQITPQQAMLDQLKFSLDGQTLTGQVGVADLATGKLWARLAGGAWNLTPYLPPQSAAATKPADKAAGATGAQGEPSQSAAIKNQPIPLPIPLLRGLNVDARLALDQLTAQEIVLKQIVLAVTAAGGQLRLTQGDFNAFNGAIKTTGALDVRAAMPAYQLNATASHIALQPALKAAMNEDRLIGTGDLNAALNTQGNTVSQLESNLNGNGKFALSNGKVKGVDLGYMLRAAQARLQGDTAPVPAEQSTDFSSVTGSAQITRGLVRNDDLQGASPLLRVSGKGSVDLPRQSIDYLLNAIVVNTATGQDGKALEKLKQLTVPITITGTFAQPKFGIDLAGLFKDQAKQKLENRVNQELDKHLGKDAAPVQNLLKGLGL